MSILRLLKLISMLVFFQMDHSTGYVLYMKDAKFINSGAYTCEVIVDTTFDTLMFTKKMMVIGKCIYIRKYESMTARLHLISKGLSTFVCYNTRQCTVSETQS